MFSWQTRAGNSNLKVIDGENSPIVQQPEHSCEMPSAERMPKSDISAAAGLGRQVNDSSTGAARFRSIGQMQCAP
jgi:hypothetical protein